MAKKSMIAREIKRQKTVERFAAKRAELKKIIADSQSSEEDKFTAREKLQKLPRDANPIRLQRRCQITCYLTSSLKTNWICISWKFLQFLSSSKLILFRRLRICNYLF